jgi:hypothetical protein
VRSSLEARNYQRPNVTGALGVDVSSFVSIDQWACVRSDEHEEKIGRRWLFAVDTAA